MQQTGQTLPARLFRSLHVRPLLYLNNYAGVQGRL